MKKSIILYCAFIVTSLSLMSCKFDKSNDFLVVNKSGIIIDSAAISCSGKDYKYKSKFIKLLNNDSVVTTLDMNNIKKNDGNYYIKLYFGESIVNKAFGYYSNGNPTNSIYKLIVKKDTIIVSEIMK